MRRTSWVAVVVVGWVAIGACGEPRAPAAPPGPSPGDAPPVAIDAPPVAIDAPPVAIDAPAVAIDAPAPDAAATCAADADHCCLPDGRLIRPGGCQPVYRGGEGPYERNPDGTCRRIECHLRCLPATARIATPRGEVTVSALRAGDPVWTVDARGARIEARVVRVAARPVVAPHAIVEVTLADGRVVRASAGHPAITGAPLADLAPGDVLDGAAITAVRALPYDGAHTWDLLPEGPTGAYWADGVLLGSTLAPAP